MARKVKCKMTNEYGTSDVFYRADNGEYYKSKEIYDIYVYEKKCRIILIDKLIDIMGYKNMTQFPTVLSKEVKILHETYSYGVILKTFNHCNKNIQYALSNKNFGNEYGKIKYIFAIIKNNINDIDKQESRKLIVENTKKVDVDIINNNTSNTKTHKDLTNFLGDIE